MLLKIHSFYDDEARARRTFQSNAMKVTLTLVPTVHTSTGHWRWTDSLGVAIQLDIQSSTGIDFQNGIFCKLAEIIFKDEVEKCNTVGHDDENKDKKIKRIKNDSRLKNH